MNWYTALITRCLKFILWNRASHRLTYEHIPPLNPWVRCGGTNIRVRHPCFWTLSVSLKTTPPPPLDTRYQAAGAIERTVCNGISYIGVFWAWNSRDCVSLFFLLPGVHSRARPAVFRSAHTAAQHSRTRDALKQVRVPVQNSAKIGCRSTIFVLSGAMAFGFCAVGKQQKTYRPMPSSMNCLEHAPSPPRLRVGAVSDTMELATLRQRAEQYRLKVGVFRPTVLVSGGPSAAFGGFRIRIRCVIALRLGAQRYA